MGCLLRSPTFPHGTLFQCEPALLPNLSAVFSQAVTPQDVALDEEDPCCITKRLHRRLLCAKHPHSLDPVLGQIHRWVLRGKAKVLGEEFSSNLLSTAPLSIDSLRGLEFKGHMVENAKLTSFFSSECILPNQRRLD